MKGYRVEHRPIGLVFECDKCDFKVELSTSFPNEKDPRARTLGAGKMNDHIVKKHPSAQFGYRSLGIR